MRCELSAFRRQGAGRWYIPYSCVPKGGECMVSSIVILVLLGLRVVSAAVCHGKTIPKTWSFYQTAVETAIVVWLLYNVGLFDNF